MTRSMTAYSRATSDEVEGLIWVVEIHAVNRKMLDIHMHVSRELLFLEIDLRKMVAKEVQRGQVTVKIQYKKSRNTQAALPLLKKLKTHWEKMAKSLGFSKSEIDLTFLLEQMDRVSLEEELGTKIRATLEKTLQGALTIFIKMKETEGKALALDVTKRLKTLSTTVGAIEKQSAKAPEKYRKKLILRLKELLEDAARDERVLREVALFAEKADITEEITRLKSHVAQTNALFKSKEKSIGRTLDFLTQEMLREINTIASKSPDLAITQKAVECKAELEKIREQVQNIE